MHLSVSTHGMQVGKISSKNLSTGPSGDFSFTHARQSMNAVLELAYYRWKKHVRRIFFFKIILF
jgi:hypothetical protein